MSFEREGQVTDGLSVARRTAAIGGGLVAVGAVARYLPTTGPQLASVLALVAAAAVVGGRTEPLLGGLGTLMVNLRVHLVFWLLFALAGLVGVGGILLGGSVEERQFGLSFLVGSLLVTGYGLEGPRSYQIHGLLSAFLVFLGLAHGGGERHVLWGAYATFMIHFLVLDRLHARAGRYRFEAAGTLARCISLGSICASLYLVGVVAAVAVGPRSEGIGPSPEVDARAGFETDPIYGLATLLFLLATFWIFVRLHRRMQRTEGGTGGRDETGLVARVARRGAVPGLALPRPVFRTDREKVARLYQDWCRDLGRRGIRRNPWMTPGAYERKVAARIAGSAEATAALTDLFRRACYSSDAIGGDELRRMRELVGWPGFGRHDHRTTEDEPWQD